MRFGSEALFPEEEPSDRRSKHEMPKQKTEKSEVKVFSSASTTPEKASAEDAHSPGPLTVTVLLNVRQVEQSAIERIAREVIATDAIEVVEIVVEATVAEAVAVSATSELRG
eukprot:g18927.t1